MYMSACKRIQGRLQGSLGCPLVTIQQHQSVNIPLQNVIMYNNFKKQHSLCCFWKDKFLFIQLFCSMLAFLWDLLANNLFYLLRFLDLLVSRLSRLLFDPHSLLMICWPQIHSNNVLRHNTNIVCLKKIGSHHTYSFNATTGYLYLLVMPDLLTSIIFLFSQRLSVRFQSLVNTALLIF